MAAKSTETKASAAVLVIQNVSTLARRGQPAQSTP
jgi:hypothetical protein